MVNGLQKARASTRLESRDLRGYFLEIFLKLSGSQLHTFRQFRGYFRGPQS